MRSLSRDVQGAYFVRLNIIFATIYQKHMKSRTYSGKGVFASTTRPPTTATIPTIVPPALLDHCRSSRVHLGTTLRDWRGRSPCRGTWNRRHRSIATESRSCGKRCGTKGLHRCTSNRSTIPARRCHRSTLLVRVWRLGRASSYSCSESSHSAGGSPTVRRRPWLDRFVVDSTR